MKKIIYYLGIIFLTIILVLNIVFTAKIEPSEHIVISYNNIIYLIGVIVLGTIIFFLSKYIDNYLNDENLKSKKNIRKYLLILVIALYIIFTVIWVVFVRPGIGADQIHVANLAQTMNRGNLDEFFPNKTYSGLTLWEYVERYTQQIPLAFIYNIFFKIIHFDEVEILRVINVIGTIGIILGIYKIGNQISKKHKINKTLLLILIETFIAIPMLTTFVYGDIPALTLCLWSAYFTMKYVETKKIKNMIFTSILTMIAYMMRMNTLIFIIATILYLLFNILEDLKTKIQNNELKESFITIGLIIMYITIIILPTKLITNYYINKYNFDKTKSYPTISWVYISMSESVRANGWYNEEIGEYALFNPEKAKEEYQIKIKERLNYFANNPGYTLDFYIKKIASMWSENTYSGVWYNLTDQIEVQKLEKPIELYQKALILIITSCSLIVLIQNRKRISLEVLFLVTIFIGGFSFHILWEAKSRYIIPYIVALIPVASICIEKFKINIYQNKKKDIDKEDKDINNISI